MPINERLRSARERVGLTLKQVEAETGIGQSSLSEYETGKRSPRLVQLQALADLYRRSLGYFFEEGDRPAETVLWREKPQDDQAATVQADFLRLCEQYRNLETWCDDHRPCLLPKAGGDASTYWYPHAERLAKQVRSALELGDRPGQSLLWVLEEVCGVKVFHLPFEPTGSAACTVHSDYGPAILLNALDVRWRRNFDLAHELFHILTWPIFRGGDEAEESTPSAQEEKFATCFAGNLLMPVETVRQSIEERIRDGKVGFEDLFGVARQFDVSVEALFWRMSFLYNRPEKETRKDIERYRGARWAFEGDRDRDDNPPPRPLRFRALAIEALREGKLSQGKFAEYLEIGRQEAMRFVEQEALPDEEVAIPSA